MSIIRSYESIQKHVLFTHIYMTKDMLYRKWGLIDKVVVWLDSRHCIAGSCKKMTTYSYVR